MLGIFSAQLKAVSVTITRIAGQFLLGKLIEPLLVDFIPRVIIHIVFLWAIVVTDTIFHNGITYTLKEIPTVIAIRPRAATDISIRFGIFILFIGKTIGIFSVIGRFHSPVFIIEIMVRIAVFYRISTTRLMLYTRIAATIYFEVLYNTITGIIE